LCDFASVPEWFDGVLGVESEWKMDFLSIAGVESIAECSDQFEQLRLRNSGAMAIHLQINRDFKFGNSRPKLLFSCLKFLFAGAKVSK